MFSGHFYHQRIRNSVAVFGALFNDINIVRKDAQGSTISQLKVPLSYAPRRDFLARIEEMNNTDDLERQIAIKLPRMSFEIVSMNYDPTRQLPKMNNCLKGQTGTTAARVYSPVPYNIQFQLNIYAKSQDDALQVVEQILPQFTPHYTVSVKPIGTVENFFEDTPITLTGVSFSDDYEAVLEARRTIIYTLDFEMKVALYKNVNANEPVITRYDIDVLDLAGDQLFPTISDSAPAFDPLTVSTSQNVAVTSDFTVRNAPKTTYNAVLKTSPTNGVATVTYDDTISTVAGIIYTTGSYSYTPDSDYTGTDQFTLNLLYGDSSSLPFTIDVNVV